jgi:flagellar hook-basal body complex protein FliE
MNDININSVLLQMRAMAAKAEGLPVSETPKTNDGGFSTLMSNAVEQVNETQQKASSLATAFETGSKDVDLSEVMVSLQKADVSFKAITQVRNKLVSAYQDIMNMPI